MCFDLHGNVSSNTILNFDLLDLVNKVGEK